jgi:iron complex outermembrane receptor protein
MKSLSKPVVLLATVFASFVGQAQQAPNGPQKAAVAAATGALEETVVTGTRREGRTVLESAAAIDVLSGEDLAMQTTANMLDTLSNSVPSFTVGQNSISDASSFVRAPSLRGLPGDELLVMLNGKRLNRASLVQVYQGGETELSFGSQGPDLASIPSIAIRSLEILKDGASAQYGSDAIAGVLNYQFRENASGFEATARYGEYITGIFPKDGADRELAFNWGLPLGNGGFLNLSAEYANNAQTVRNATRPSAVAFAQTYPELASQLPHYPGPVQEFGTPPSESIKAFVNSALPLDNGDKIYFFGNYAHIAANESFNYRLPKDVTDSYGNEFSRNFNFYDIYLDPCTSAYSGCPAGGFINNSHTYNFASMYPAGFTPRFYGTTVERFAAVGYKGKSSAGLTYDFSLTSGHNELSLGLRNTLNPSLGPDSPKSFNDGAFVQDEYTASLDVSAPWKVPGFVAPVSVAAGIELHHEKYSQKAGDAASFAAGPYAYQPLYDCIGTVCTPTLDSNGDQVIATKATASNGYGGNSATFSASTRNTAAYVDLEGDLTDRLTLGVAGRYENYSTFGSTTLGKFQVRYTLTDALALRATISNGFHAPTAGQQNVQTVSTTFTSFGSQVEIGTYPVDSAVAKYYGSRTIKPETSTNFSAGLVYNPGNHFTATLDAYQIDVHNRITISRAYEVTLADIQAQPALSYVGQGGSVQYFTNGFSTRTKGVDLILTKSAQLPNDATLSATLAYNYNKTDVTSRDSTVVSDYQVVDIQHYAPNSRVNTTFAYTQGKLTVGLHENYYGTHRDEFDYPGQVFGAKLTTDLDVAYEVMPKVVFAIGARNLFNTFPDRIKNNDDVGNTIYQSTHSLWDGELYPRGGGPFGYNGRFVYARVGAKF